LNSFGEIVESTYMSGGTFQSVCNAITLNYLEDELVAVGYLYSTAATSRSVLIIKAEIKQDPGSTTNLDLFTLSK
jgi:hypothetical protein